MSELPEGWVRCQLEDCVEILDSKRIPLNSDERAARTVGKAESDLYPYYGATGEVGKIDDYLFDEELIALGEDGVPFLDPLRNKAYLIAGKTWVNNHAHVLRAKNGVSENRYLLYGLNQTDFHDFVNGGTRLKLTQANMCRIPVSLAPLAEQKVIADKLDALLAQVDNLQARLDSIPAILKRFRQSVLSAAVSGKLTEEWRGTRHGDNSKWIDSTIDDIAEVKGGKRLPAGETVLDEKTPYPYLRVTDFSEFSVDGSNLKYLSASVQSAISRYTISSRDVFISIAGTIGSVGMVPSWLDGANLTENAAKIVIDGSRADAKYVMYHLAGPIAQAEIAGAVVSNTQPKLALFRIQKLRVPLPPLAEQAEIVRRVESLFAFADQIEARVQEATARVKHLTQSILAKAFRGELTEEWRQAHPELVSGENSAAALLERIRVARAVGPEVKGKRGRKTAENDSAMRMAAKPLASHGRGRVRKVLR